MAVPSKLTRPMTRIWKDGQNGREFVKDIEGLPYGKDANIHIPLLGDATLVGVETSGSGKHEITTVVSYVLK